jgi:site-specific DNA-cytosine methylase
VWRTAAPSFGSVSKTYILHPDAGKEGYPLRVVSVREVLSIMGFRRDFHFPAGTALSKRYSMAANAVSPVMAEHCAVVIRQMLTGEAAEDR